MVLEDILSVEGNENTAHISSQVEHAKERKINIIDGANFEAKYIVQESGEVRYSGSAGENYEKAMERGFNITF